MTYRRTSRDSGFCTFQPVVDGGACPWNLDCRSCDNLVLSGAELLYWRRKREQWELLADAALDGPQPTACTPASSPPLGAIDGLEQALAGLGLLDDALAPDMREPQDYFHRVWSTAFRTARLGRQP